MTDKATDSTIDARITEIRRQYHQTLRSAQDEYMQVLRKIEEQYARDLNDLKDEHPQFAVEETPLPPGYHYRYQPRAAGESIVKCHIVKGNKVLCGTVKQGELALVYGGPTVLCVLCGERMD